jgi:hypothetical protein
VCVAIVGATRCTRLSHGTEWGSSNELYRVSFLPAVNSVAHAVGLTFASSLSCLDRTNVAQFSAGVEAIGQQLVVMGIRSKAKLDPSSNIVRVLIDMYVDIGDSVALQYGGSEAHKKVTATNSDSNTITLPIGKASWTAW